VKKEATVNGILYSANKDLLDVDSIHSYLSKESYWAENIPRSIVERSIKGSYCFGAYDDNKQVAFARVITDEATFAYLADVFVVEAYRRKGISKNLMKFIMDKAAFDGVRSFMLATKDAHSLYEKYGFQALQTPERYMILKYFEKYKKQ
jgi:GNAT superfamily N-acetyltransferase